MKISRRTTAAFWLATMTFLGGQAVVEPALAASPLGTWYTADKDSQVRIVNCGDGYLRHAGLVERAERSGDRTAETRQEQRRRVKAKPAAHWRADRTRHEAERSGRVERQRLQRLRRQDLYRFLHHDRRQRRRSQRLRDEHFLQIADLDAGKIAFLAMQGGGGERYFARRRKRSRWG